ncbi:MAG: S1C family serine protease [Acutalibacteraceae bacterium]
MNENENLLPQEEENESLSQDFSVPPVNEMPDFTMPEAPTGFSESEYRETEENVQSSEADYQLNEGPGESDEPVYQLDEEPAESDEPVYQVPQENLYSGEPNYQETEAPSQQPYYTADEAYQNNSDGGYNSYSTPSTAYVPPFNANTNQGFSYGNVQNPQPPKKKSLSKGIIAAAAIVGLCLVVAVIGIFVSLFKGADSNDITVTADEATTQMITTTENNAMNISTTEASSGVANSVWVAEKVRPSVVGVMVYSNGTLSGEGSGVLASVDSTGKYTYVVTCAHVINEKNVTYGVLLLDGRSFNAEMVAIDERTDIGVLKIEATGLPLAEFGDSSTLKVGEPIYAIGNPGGSEYFGSFTDGIVSAIDRSITATYTMTCIQHNAAINPGNSGGALVNSAGQVVGINSSKIASTEFEGMGFAVPTAIVNPVVNALITYGYVPNRPKLGIQYAPVSSNQLYSMIVSIKGLPKGSLVIAGINEDSTLLGTQAQVGDLIIAVNGKEMTDSSVLLDLVDTGAVGDTLTLTLCRIERGSYQTSTFDVTITLVEDKGVTTTTAVETTASQDGYYYGGASSFEDFFNDYFGW